MSTGCEISAQAPVIQVARAERARQRAFSTGTAQAIAKFGRELVDFTKARRFRSGETVKGALRASQLQSKYKK